MQPVSFAKALPGPDSLPRGCSRDSSSCIPKKGCVKPQQEPTEPNIVEEPLGMLKIIRVQFASFSRPSRSRADAPQKKEATAA